MKPTFYARYSPAILLIAVFLMPFALLGARRAMLSNKNDVKQWLPDQYEETRVFRDFRQQFAGEEFVLVSWDGCRLDDQRLRLMAAKLVPPPEANVPEEERYFSEVITGASVMETLTGGLVNLPEEVARARLMGSLLGPDGQQTCLVLTISEEGKKQLRKTIGQVYDVARIECNIPNAELHLGGPASDNVAIDEAGEQSLARLAGLAGVIGLAISWWCLRSIKLVAIVLAAGLYGAAASLALVWYTGSTMNAIVLTMPSLVYVAAISGAIHLANYYRDTIHEEGLEGAPGRAIRHAWLPLTLATSTTAVGLLTLCYSELVPIQLFGFYSALGVLVTGLILFFFMPATFQMFPLRGEPSGKGSEEAHGFIDPAFFKGWHRVGEWIVGHHTLVTVTCLLFLAFCGWGMTKMETSVQLMRLFSPKAKVVTDYQWLEANLGELIPMEIVLNMDVDREKCKLTFLERMELVDRVQKEIESIPEVGSALSVATFAPELPKPHKRGRGIQSILEQIAIKNRDKLDRKLRNEKLEKNRDKWLVGDYLRENDGTELWRISARVSALKNVDYAKFVDEIEARVEPILAAANKQSGSDVTATYTGLVPLVYKAQNSLLDGLIFGFVTDVVLIVVAMIVAQRALSAGLILLFPSVFPPIAVFGMMGWLGIVVDIGTVMTPAVALGVSVDDIVHFMLQFRRAVAAGATRQEAVMAAYHHCGRAMYQSWGVIGLGLSVFAMSPFTPTQRFGYLMITLLTAALVGNLFLLPALLAGPLGRLYVWKTGRKERKQAAAEAARAATTEPHVPKRPHSLEEPVTIEMRRSVRT